MSTFLFLWLIYFFTFFFSIVYVKLDVLILYAFVLCPPEDGDLSPRRVGEFMSVYDIWLYINYVHLSM